MDNQLNAEQIRPTLEPYFYAARGKLDETFKFREEGCFLMTGLFHWFAANATVFAILVTAGVAVLLICCLECSNCSKREKDDLFKRHGV